MTPVRAISSFACLRQLAPHQHFGHVEGRRDQHEGLRARELRPAREVPREEERNPAAHGQPMTMRVPRPSAATRRSTLRANRRWWRQADRRRTAHGPNSRSASWRARSAAHSATAVALVLFMSERSPSQRSAGPFACLPAIGDAAAVGSAPTSSNCGSGASILRD